MPPKELPPRTLESDIDSLLTEMSSEIGYKHIDIYDDNSIHQYISLADNFIDNRIEVIPAGTSQSATKAFQSFVSEVKLRETLIEAYGLSPVPVTSWEKIFESVRKAAVRKYNLYGVEMVRFSSAIRAEKIEGFLQIWENGDDNMKAALNEFNQNVGMNLNYYIDTTYLFKTAIARQTEG